MTNETSKSITRRGFDRRFATRWFVGDGIDIGAGSDPLSQFYSFFPLMKSVKDWDLSEGDATFMADIPDETFDFVHSSHCLEHIVDPHLALKHWIRICKKNGHLILIIPDEDLYEQEVWPSTYNTDHKKSFTISKKESWSPVSVNVFDLINNFIDQLKVIKVELLDNYYFYNFTRFDQTLTSMSESAIEVILKKI